MGPGTSCGQLRTWQPVAFTRAAAARICATLQEERRKGAGTASADVLNDCLGAAVGLREGLDARDEAPGRGGAQGHGRIGTSGHAGNERGTAGNTRGNTRGEVKKGKAKEKKGSKRKR